MKKRTKNFWIAAGITVTVVTLAYVIYKRVTISERTRQDIMPKTEPEEHSVGTSQDYVERRKSFMTEDANESETHHR